MKNYLLKSGKDILHHVREILNRAHHSENAAKIRIVKLHNKYPTEN